MRTHPCVRLFCIIDTLTSASVLPGINDIIEQQLKRVVGADHDCMGNMSRPSILSQVTLSLTDGSTRKLTLADYF
jgi:hypothetical protein